VPGSTTKKRGIRLGQGWCSRPERTWTRHGERSQVQMDHRQHLVRHPSSNLSANPTTPRDRERDVKRQI